MIGYGKSINTPKTPEHLQSINRLRDNQYIIQSKSINGSNDKSKLKKFKNEIKSFEECIEVELPNIKMSQDLEAGQDVLYQSNYNYQGSMLNESDNQLRQPLP